MAVCSNCGAQIGDNDRNCPNCGASQQNGQPQQYNPQFNQSPQVEDKGGFLWGLLGCCIPIVGLILFLVWKDSKPNTAKAAGIGALVSVIVAIIYYVVVFVILGAAGIMSAGM